MFQKQKLFYLNLRANNWMLISSSNYVENDCMPLPMLGTSVSWLMINLTEITILIILFQNLWGNSFFSKLRYYVNKEILRTIYFAMFYSYLNYFTTVWRKSRIPQKLIIFLQEKGLRIMSFLPFSFHSSSYIHDYNILTFSDIVNTEDCSLIFEY